MGEITKTPDDQDLPDDLVLGADGSATIGGTPDQAETHTDLEDPVVASLSDEEDETTAKVDEELDAAETDAEREAIRERRRKERKSRSARARERVEHLEATLRALEARNQALSQQVAGIQDANTGTQLAQMDTYIAQADQAAEHFKSVIAAATVAGNGSEVANATEYMIAARARADKLRALKDNATRALAAPKPLDPVMVNKSATFLGKHKWYGGPQSADPDSKVLTLLDNGLTSEGWDPTTDTYWQELERRAAKYLPHRIKPGATPTPNGNGQRRAPVTGSSAASTAVSPGAGRVYTLSPDRVKAIKDAGMWDDVAERNKMIKTYREYDRTNGRS